MKNVKVEGVKIGNVVNLSINGKLHKKNCGSAQEADELFKLVIKAKENPTDENVKAIRLYLNEATRIALLAGLESDIETGEIFLAGFNTPVPTVLVDVIKEYHENGYPLDAIINFWKLLMINPDVRVRTSLFDFITTHDFVLTDKGYMVVYKAVYRAQIKKDTVKAPNADLNEFVSNQYLTVKKYKKSPKNYVVIETANGDYKAIKAEVVEDWAIENYDEVEVLGNLNDLFLAIGTVVLDGVESDNEVVHFTDMHTRSMNIQLGVPVKQARKLCDANPAQDCSNGLHVGATKYVEKFAGNNGIILACFVNPANVVAVPDYDHSKMRVDEYYPFAVATFEDGKIDIIEQAYFEEDYCEYETEELEKQIANVQAGELPIEKAVNAEEEVRPMQELMKILESRLLDLNAE